MTQDAKPIADQIACGLADTEHESFVATWNLRALLLRFADGDFDLERSLWQVETVAADEARRLGLAIIAVASDSWLTLTPLGREVARLLRPEPWLAAPDEYAEPFGTGWVVRLGDHEETTAATCFDQAAAERIAALLTADGLQAAKAYKLVAP